MSLDAFLAPGGEGWRWPAALLVNLVLGTAAWRMGLVRRSGWIGGVLLGTVLLARGGLAAYAVLLAFFVLGTGATLLGYRRKTARGLAQEDGGRRGARHALANCGVGLALAALLPGREGAAWAAAYVAAFATAAADTLGSEIGQLAGRRAVDPLRLRAVPPGTEGAVSLEGSLAGLGGAALLAGLAVGLGLLPPWLLAAPVAGALVGTTAESLVGSAGGRGPWKDNEVLNFLSTAVGAAAGAVVALGIEGLRRSIP